MFIHARMGSMSSILATVSTTVSAAHSTNRVAGDRRTARDRTNRRRSRLFPAPCYLFVFPLPPRPVPLPPFPPAAPRAPLPKGRRNRPRFPVLFSLLSNSFSELYFAIFSVPNVTRFSNGRA